MSNPFSKSKKESKESTPKYTGEENHDIFKTPRELLKVYKDDDRPTGNFEPAIFYNKVPARYEGHLEYIGPVSVSVKNSWTYNKNRSTEQHGESMADKEKADLEKKIKDNFKTTAGNLVILRETSAIFSNIEDCKEDNERHSADVTITVIGDLYLATGVKTVFEDH
jgi:hypothetical protein